MKKVLFTTTALVAFAGAAFAAVSDVDSDGDGVASFSELSAAYAISEEDFITIDTNGDQVVDDAELAAAQEAGIIPQS